VADHSNGSEMDRQAAALKKNIPEAEVVRDGSSNPAVTNDTDANRALNRRVQLEISPNEKLRAQESGNN
jgi:flagellar motor protein MotB